MASIKKIIILFGGSSSEREVSIKSGEGIFQACQDLGYDAKLVDLNNISDLNTLKEFDIVFIALHGFEGESGTLQKNLDEMGISYTGSSYDACKNTWNKSKFKNILESKSIPTPRGFSIKTFDKEIQSPFSIFKEKYGEEIKELFLKPEEDGSSIDIFQIKSLADLSKSVLSAKNTDRGFLFEESINHREFTVSILNNKCLPILEIKTENSFYDYDAKYISNSTQLIEVDFKKELKKEIEDLSLGAFKALGCSGWGRVDLLQDKEGKFYILEINTVPGMTNHSCVPKSAALAGISYKKLVNLIIDDAYL